MKDILVRKSSLSNIYQEADERDSGDQCEWKSKMPITTYPHWLRVIRLLLSGLRFKCLHQDRRIFYCPSKPAICCVDCARVSTEEGEIFYEVKNWHVSFQKPRINEKSCHECNVLLYTYQPTANCALCLSALRRQADSGFQENQQIYVSGGIIQSRATLEDFYEENVELAPSDGEEQPER